MLETDYLVIGGGAKGIAFTDTLITESDCHVIVVDQRHQPGGHWVDAYPFVRLHQPSAFYGVNSLPLGEDRIDSSGVNAGFYERAGASEMIDYYRRVLDDVLLPSGQMQFLGSSTYLGEEDGTHVVRNHLSGHTSRIKVRRKLVDATIVAASIPARHTPGYQVDQDVRLVTPNQLVDAMDARGYTIVGAGKTAMDTCFWLLEQGVDPDDIAWIRPRESWMVDRTFTQPVAINMVRFQSAMFAALAQATSGHDYAERMEASGVMCRIDDSMQAPIFRGANISMAEVEALRRIEHVIRRGKVQRITSSRIILSEGEVATNAGRLFVDCTAAGLSTAPPPTIFEEDRINVYFTTMGVAPWSASIIGRVEAMDLPLEEKNRLCPGIPRAGTIEGQLDIIQMGLPLESHRRNNAELMAYYAGARLNPGRALAEQADDPEVQAAYGTIMENYQPAIANLEKLCAREGR